MGCLYMHCHQINTSLELICPVPTSGTVTYPWKQGSLMSILDTELRCPRFVLERHTQPDNWDQIFLPTTLEFTFAAASVPAIFFWWLVVDPNKNSINCPSTWVDASIRDFMKPLGNWHLFSMVVWVFNVEAWMSIYSINKNISAAVSCVGMTNSKCGQ